MRRKNIYEFQPGPVNSTPVDYISTRDTTASPHKFTDILLGGLSADGGLFMPATYPRLEPSLLDAWRDLLATEGYAALAAEVVKLFVTTFRPQPSRSSPPRPTARPSSRTRISCR